MPDVVSSMYRWFLVLVGIFFWCIPEPAAQIATGPTAKLTQADSMTLPGSVDSNSPVVWDRDEGDLELHVLTSINGRPSLATGDSLTLLDSPTPVTIEPWPGGGVWMEAIVKDVEAWYGFYHNENQAWPCGEWRRLSYPRIGVARSTDLGETWTDLGIILDMSIESFACGTRNLYFAGGFGDMSVIVDRLHRDIYIYFSQYGRSADLQGVGVARLAWADREQPVGKLSIWNDGVWLPATRLEDDQGNENWVYAKATPLVTPTRPWHAGNRVVNAFWGPSIHWNAYLQRYVMLLNRSRDENFRQEGIYIAFNPRIGDPAGWSAPQKLLEGGSWYPQVVGLEVGRGTDAWAGRVARFFMGGKSEYLIEFAR